MDDENLKKLFEHMEIPEPSEDARSRALKAAMEEFEAQKEKATEPSKGISWFARLMGKTGKGGSPVMNATFMRRISVYASAALVLIVLASITISKVVFRNYTISKYDVARLEETTKRPAGQQPPPPIDEPRRYAQEEVPPIEKQYRSEPVPAAPESVQSELATGKTSDSQMKRKAAPSSTRDFEDQSRGASGLPMDNRADMKMAAAPPPPAETERFYADQEMAVLEEAAPVAKPTPSYQANEGLLAKRESKAMVQGYGGVAQAPVVPSAETYAEPAYKDVGRDQFEHKEDNPVKVVREEPVSTFSIDVDTASYAFVRRSLMEGVLPQKDAVRVEEMINYFDYDYPAPTDRKRPFKASVAVYPTPWNKNTMLLHIGIKGHEVEAKEKPRSNLVFLLDVSGSMNSPDKLPLLKNSMRMLVDELDPRDTVGIVVYAGAAGAVLEPTPAREKGKILAALERLEAGGSTAGAEGIRQAYAMAEAGFDPKAVNRVILATDGDFNVGITNHDELKSFIERKRETGIYLSVLGFGQGNYNDSLMQTLAENGNGVAAYIDTLSEARKVLVDEASSTLYPIATDVKIQVEFNPARVAEYRLIGYETRMLKREDFNNDKVDAGDIGSGHTVTAIYEITPVGSPALLVEELRYGAERNAKSDSKSGEYAFLRLRYKLPGEKTSRLIEQPIGKDSEFASVEKAPAEMRFASSVAAFGQILKGGRYTGGFGYDDVLSLAGSSKGADRFGYRAEFINLIRLAKSAQAMGAH